MTHAVSTPGPRAPRAFHAAAAGWVLSMLLLGAAAPDPYRRLLQEDYFIEWWTVGLFFAAAVALARVALPARRWFDLGVALFCVFVAGEEFSWGQRLLGFEPPVAFAERNTQQEFTIHNFADVFGKPKFVLMAALAGYGLALPLAALLPRLRGGLERIGATGPPVALAPWFAVAIALLLWYPYTLTGEWVEVLAGGLFLAAAARSARRLALAAALAAGAALALSAISARARGGGPEHVACAQQEARALLGDLETGAAAEPRLRRTSGRLHKRIWTADLDGYLDLRAATGFVGVRCAGGPLRSGAKRRATALDPWGMPYWLRLERRADGARELAVYSTGPNRRRDSFAGDDIVARALVR